MCGWCECWCIFCCDIWIILDRYYIKFILKINTIILKTKTLCLYTIFCYFQKIFLLIFSNGHNASRRSWPDFVNQYLIVRGFSEITFFSTTHVSTSSSSLCVNVALLSSLRADLISVKVVCHCPIILNIKIFHFFEMSQNNLYTGQHVDHVSTLHLWAMCRILYSIKIRFPVFYTHFNLSCCSFRMYCN